jgi:hypothetical protein
MKTQLMNMIFDWLMFFDAVVSVLTFSLIRPCWRMKFMDWMWFGDGTMDWVYTEVNEKGK